MDGEVAVEDLGNINITIREGMGGRGTSGNIGGGPSGGEQRQQKSISDALSKVLAAHESQVRQMGTKVPPVAPGSFAWVDRLVKAQQLREEITGFSRRPTAAGATALLQQGTQTRSMLMRLGTSAATAGMAMVAVGAVVGAAAMAIKGLQMASEHVASRIQTTWKFSPYTAAAMAEQRIAEVAVQLEEAARNGQQYASVIRAQTDELVAKARLDIQLARATSELSVAFSKLKIGVFDYLTVVLKISERAREIAEYTPIMVAGRYGAAFMERSLLNVEDSGLTMIQSLRLTILRMLGQNEWANELQNELMEEIVRNTRKNNPATMNAWFEADIKAITGLPV